MKYSTFLLAAIILISYSCSPARKNELAITNHSSDARVDELIILPRKMLEEKTGTIPPGKYVQLQSSDNTPVLLQYDDLDNDGEWDEATMLCTSGPHETSVFTVFIADAPAAIKAVAKAHVRHKRKNADDSFGNDLRIDSIPAGQIGADFNKVALPPFLTEGPAWENDKVGFRIYFDVRNGKDIWGKTTARMILDEAGVNPKDDYHKQADWGMDVLKVGKSLGAGSLALSVPLGNGSDTLIRLGGINMGKVIYTKIADGPIRAILRLQYPEWKLMDNLTPVSLTEEISIWGGQYFYESRITMKNAPENSKLVSGIVNLHSKQSFEADTAGYKILYTYDVQTENNDKLGMGIILKNELVNNVGATSNTNTDVQNTYTVVMNAGHAKPAIFRFYAGWEKSNEQFATQKGFQQYLQQQAVYMQQPLTVK